MAWPKGKPRAGEKSPETEADEKPVLQDAPRGGHASEHESPHTNEHA